MWFSSYTTDGQTDRHTHHNSSHPSQSDVMTAPSRSSLYVALGRVRITVMSMSVCLSVCLSVRRITRKPHSRTLRQFFVRVACGENFLCILTVAEARSSSNDATIRHVLPVLQITSRSRIMALWRVMFISKRRKTVSMPERRP